MIHAERSGRPVEINHLHAKAVRMLPHHDVENAEAALQSMDEYAAYLNTGFLDLLIRTLPRGGNPRPEEAVFSLTTCLKDYESIMLGDDELKALSVVSFMTKRRLSSYNQRLTRYLEGRDESIVITQIQGPSKGRNGFQPTYKDLPDSAAEHASAVKLLNLSI